MLNVVVPIVDKAKDYKNLLKNLLHYEDINIIIGVTSSLRNEVDNLIADNVYIVEFEDGSLKEEIINSLQAYLGAGALLILRKPITIDEFNSFVKSRQDLCVCYKERNRFQNLMFMLWQKILKLFLGLKEYDGDNSVIYFSEDITSVLLGTNDLSFATRVDRWRGLEQTTIAVKGEPNKTEVGKKSIIKNSIIAGLSIVIPTIITVLVCLFVNVSIIIGLLLVCIDVIGVITALLMLVLILFNIRVGKKHFSNAQILQQIGKNIEEDDEELEENLNQKEGLLDEEN